MARGGRREGAGRPHTTNTGKFRDTPHRRRPDLDYRHPVHCTLRLDRSLLSSLRNGKSYDAIRATLRKILDRAETFRIIYFSLQSNHVHVIVEARDRVALSRGMQSFAINAARAIHETVAGCGKVWKFRYHARQIKSASHARSAVAYVLNNWRRHRRDLECKAAMSAHVDPYASWHAYRPWAEKFSVPVGYEVLPVSAPRTWLLRAGLKGQKRIDEWEIPAMWEHTGRL